MLQLTRRSEALYSVYTLLIIFSPPWNDYYAWESEIVHSSLYSIKVTALYCIQHHYHHRHDMSLLFKRHGDDFVPGYEPGHISVNGRYVPTSEEVTAYQNARDPWDKSVRFGYYTLAFLCPLLLLFIITNGVWLLRVRYRRPFARRLSALCRLATYPRLPRNISSKVDLIWTTTPLGPSLITIAGLIVSTCICFVNKYQYFLPFYGSSPLYLRAEWIALAMMPFV